MSNAPVTSTPYETGQRLIPQVWAVDSDTSAAHYGRVDFDDQDAVAVVRAHVERDGDGYVVRVQKNTDAPLRVEVTEV